MNEIILNHLYWLKKAIKKICHSNECSNCELKLEGGGGCCTTILSELVYELSDLDIDLDKLIEEIKEQKKKMERK